MRGIFPAQEPMLQQGRALLQAEEARGLQSLVAGKMADIRRYDIPGMGTAVAIIACGRSGADLLASYLDGHGDIVMMPPMRSDRIYQFFERYESLSLHDKLIAYPVFSADDLYNDFFQGLFPIPAADYYAAVKALLEIYGGRPPEFLESRRTFFKILHVAYAVAAGQRPAGPRPLILYAQHAWNNQLAARLLEDFPQARFIHTVRDPLTNCGRAFENRLDVLGAEPFSIAALVIWNLTQRDVPHRGMESRTLAVRFEDLHLHLEVTMRALAGWLGIPFRSSLLDSTFGGMPWVVRRGASSWSGARPEQAARDLRYLSLTDQYLLSALLHEDFLAWDYPCPKIFNDVLVRLLTCAIVLFIPMRTEIIAARVFSKKLRSPEHGGIRHAAVDLLKILVCRLAIMSIVAIELCRRLAFGKNVARLSVIKIVAAENHAPAHKQESLSGS